MNDQLLNLHQIAEGAAVIIGASGGIGHALFEQLHSSGRYSQVIGCARHHFIPLDLLDETSIANAAQHIARTAPEVRLVIDATGVLESDKCIAEKSWRQLDAASMAYSFAINTIGPALLIKHFLPLFPPEKRCIFATLSARLGSIDDNRLGGWYSYRASKAALNQIVRTAALELQRVRPMAICVALHPGTVETPLSAHFAKTNLEVQIPQLAAQRILECVDSFSTKNSGGFFDQLGREIGW